MTRHIEKAPSTQSQNFSSDLNRFYNLFFGKMNSKSHQVFPIEFESDFTKPGFVIISINYQTLKCSIFNEIL